MKNKLKKLINKVSIPHVFLIFTTIWLRFVHLGYSDYQGDEVKAMLRPDAGQSLSDFLFAQRKGPLQFLVTYLMSFLTPEFYKNFLLRLPFAIAGALAIFFFYKLVKLHFGKKIALYASLFLSINGILVAFSRIVQYQSFTILFFIMALYYFSLALYKDRWKFKGWYFGMFYWAISALFHYDAVFTGFFVVYILVLWLKKYSDISVKKKLLHLFLSISLCGILVGLFYVPYGLSIGESQTNYWQGRISDDPGGKVSNSSYLFEVYNPIFILEVWLVLIAASFFKIKKNWPVLVWISFPLLFMQGLIDVPGTHIYTYLIPAAILMGFGVIVIKNFMKALIGKKWAKKLNKIGLTTYFVIAFMLIHTIMVDHKVEYPWYQKDFLFFTIPKPIHRYHLSIFGFPYNRKWEEIKNYIRDNNESIYYGTNEKDSITRFYLHGYKKEGELAEHFIYVYGPQSHNERILQDKPYYWVRILKKDPVKIFKLNGKQVAKIYKMPLGTIDDIR